MTCTHCLKTAPLLCHLPHALQPAWIDLVRRWRSLLTNLSQIG